MTTTTGTEPGATIATLNSSGSERLFALLQVTNAAFPTGAFTHSHGFETWIADGTVSDAATAEARILDWLRFNITTCDAAAAALAYRSSVWDKMQGLAAIDQQLGSLKLTREARKASVVMGEALIAAGTAVFGLEQLVSLASLVKSGSCAGHNAVAYGVLAAGLGLSEDEAVTSYLWTSMSGLVGVVQRLVPLGQTEAQRLIARSSGFIQRCGAIARGRELQDMSASFTALDIASMRHERLHTRLCIS